MRLTKGEQAILLDRLGLPDCLYECLFMEDDSWGTATKDEVYDMCRKLEKIVLSGEFPPASEFSREEIAILNDAAEGSTLAPRAHDQDDEECNHDSRHTRAFNRVANSLETKLSAWMGERVSVPRW